MDINLSFVKSDYFLKKLREYLNQLFQESKDVKGIVLFGSLARGDFIYSDDKVSDIDIIVVFSDGDLPNNHIDKINYQINLIGLKGIGFDSIWLTKTEFKNLVQIKADLILSALHEGIFLFDPEGFLDHQKTILFKELREKGVVKKNKYWIWPLKYLGEEINW